MCSKNSASLEIAFAHITNWDPLLLVWLTDVPKDMLQIFDEVLQQVVLIEFPHYTKVRHTAAQFVRRNCVIIILLVLFCFV